MRIQIRLFSFNKILLFIKKLAFDGFYPLLVVLKNRFLFGPLYLLYKICRVRMMFLFHEDFRHIALL